MQINTNKKKENIFCFLGSTKIDLALTYFHSQ